MNRSTRSANKVCWARQLLDNKRLAWFYRPINTNVQASSDHYAYAPVPPGPNEPNEPNDEGREPRYVRFDEKDVDSYFINAPPGNRYVSIHCLARLGEKDLGSQNLLAVVPIKYDAPSRCVLAFVAVAGMLT
jgi:hypothetical protein